MFSLNGIVYASEKTENIQVVSAKPLDDMMTIPKLKLCRNFPSSTENIKAFF